MRMCVLIVFSILLALAAPATRAQRGGEVRPVAASEVDPAGQDPVAEACFAAPSRACAMALAFAVADGHSNPQWWAQAVLAVAIAQEVGDMAQAGNTLSYLLDNVGARLPEPAARVWAFGRHPVFKPELEKAFVGAPVTARRLADYLLDLGRGQPVTPRLQATMVALGYLAAAGEPERARAVIGAVPEREVRPVLRIHTAQYLIRQGDVDTALGFVQDVLETMPMGHARDKLLQPVTYSLAQEGHFDAVYALAKEIKRSQVSGDAYGFMAWQMFERGQVLEARRLIAAMRRKGQLQASGQARMTALRIDAYGGIAENLPGQLRGYDRFRAVAAVVAGDLEHAMAYLDAEARAPKYADFRYADALEELIDAYVHSGQMDLSPFLAQVPPKYRRRVLPLIGARQARLGDLDGAWRTFAEALTHGAGHVGGYNARFLELEKLLMRRGEPGKALRLAHELRDARSLAHLALMLD